MTSSKRSHDLTSDEYRVFGQDALDQKNRRSTLVGALKLVQRQRTGAVDLMLLVEVLDLGEELAELAGPAHLEPERHRRLAEARQAAGLAVDQDGETGGTVE